MDKDIEYRPEYIKPKNTGGRKATWDVSPQTVAAVKYYAQYTQYTEDEVVDMFLIQLRDDPKFKNWLMNQRRNKRAISQMYDDAAAKDGSIG